MTLLLITIALATASCGYDFSVSLRRAKKYGLASELSPVVKALSPHVGLQSAMLSWVLVPHVLFTIVCLNYGWVFAYALYSGYLIKGALMQLASVALERELDAQILGALNSRCLPPSDSREGPDTTQKKDSDAKSD